MRSHLTFYILAGVLVGGCAAPDEEAEAPAAAATAESATAADEAALEQLRADYVTHYNLHHADVVADMFMDSAVGLWADGGVTMDRAATLAQLQAGVAGQPTLDLSTGDMMVLGEQAVAHGNWNVSTSVEGAAEPLRLSGHYLTYFVKQDGQWKIAGVITNYDAPPPEGMPEGVAPDEPPPDEGTMTDLVNAYVTAFNAGDAAAVSNLYTDDGFHAYANRPPAVGQAAIQTALTERFAAGQSSIEIHDVGTMDLGNGHALDGGWYTLSLPDNSTMTGSYLNLLRQQPDGTWKIHWGVSNGGPDT